MLPDVHLDAFPPLFAELGARLLEAARPAPLLNLGAPYLQPLRCLCDARSQVPLGGGEGLDAGEDLVFVACGVVGHGLLRKGAEGGFGRQIAEAALF